MKVDAIGFRDKMGGKLISFVFGRDGKSSLRAHLAIDALGTFALKITAAILGFLTVLILARLLGPKGYGTYAYAMSWVRVLEIPAIMGLDQLLTRETAICKTRSAWGLMRGLLRWSNCLVLLASISLALLAATITWLLKHRFNPEMLVSFWIALIILPLSTLTRLRQMAMQGLQHVVVGQFPEMLIRPLLFIALVVSLYLFFKENLNAPIAVGMNVVATGVTFFVGTLLLYTFLPQPVREAEPSYQTRVWVRSALPLLLISGLGIINSQTDMIMLGAIKGAEATGIYAVASRGAGLIIFILGSVNMAIAPIIASLYESGEMQRLQRVITKSARVVLLLSLPVALGLIVFGRWVLLLFGQEFTSGVTTLAILSTGQLVSAAAGSVGLILVMTGYERDTVVGIALSAVLNVALNALLIPRWGIEGAAVATSSSMILWNLLLAIRVYNRLGLDSTALGRISQWREE